MTSNPGNEAMLESWQLALHDKSLRTIELYLAEVRRFATWLAEHDRPADDSGDLLGVTRGDVEAWLTDLRARGLSANTLRSRWIALRNFYGWAADVEEIATNPLEKVKVSKPDTPPMRLLSDDDLRALLAACEGRSFNDRRDYAIVRTFAATGLRLSELVSIAADDLDLVRRTLLVPKGKGDKARLVRFDPETALALDNYRRARGRHRLARRPEFWLGLNGPLTRKGIPSILDKRTALAGIDHVNPHMLRHGWADRAKRAGMSDSDLQVLGGWESAEVMRRYGSARAADRALDAYDRLNPMEGL